MSRLLSFNPEPFETESGFGAALANQELGEMEQESEFEFRRRGGRSFSPRAAFGAARLARLKPGPRPGPRRGYFGFPSYPIFTGAASPYAVVEPPFEWPAAFEPIETWEPGADAGAAPWPEPEWETGARARARRRPAAVGGAWAGKLAPLLNRHRGDIPLEFLLGWIAVESGGNIADLTRLDERGYFQIHPEESRALGLDHKRLSVDPDYSIAGGVKLVQHYAKRTQQLGFTPATDLFWHVVKLLHWLPKGVAATLAHMKQNGFRASNWTQFRDYMLANRTELLWLIQGKAGTGWDPASGIRNVEALFERGRALAALAGGAGSPAPASPGPAPAFDSAAFRQRIVRIANEELARWARGKLTETNPAIRRTLQDYWKIGVGANYSDAQLADRTFQKTHPWSAAFISWVMRKAGAGRLFKYNSYHSTYTRAAIDNRLANNNNPFKAYRTTEIAPQVGDIICNSRAGSGATYDNVKPGMTTHCDIVTEVRPGRLTVVGGNVFDNVGQKTVKTDADGRLPKKSTYFAVIRIGGAQSAVPIAPAPPPGPTPSPTPLPLTPSAGSAPKLIESETTPKGLTLYLNIDLKIRDQSNKSVAPITGVFIPEGYTPGAAADIALYLHGHKAPPIDRYWNAARVPYGAFREGLNAAGRNVILVAPTLGASSEAGLLVKPGGLDAYLALVLAALRAYGPHGGAKSAPTLGALILACHSGGGARMRELAGGRDRAVAQIRECWGFDCTYNKGDDVFWAGWARARPSAKVYIYYIPASKTAPLAEALRNKKVPNAIVLPSLDKRPKNERTTPWHYFVPIEHWDERLRGAAFLAAHSRGAAPPSPSPSPTPPAPPPPADVAGMSHAQFIEFVGAHARKAMAATGVPGSVTVAQAIIETGWGKHTIGDAKNLFGIKGRGPAGSVRAPTREYLNGKWVSVDADFAKYDSFEQSVTEHAKFFLRNRRYAPALQVKNDPDAFAREIHKAGYATAPNYATKLIELMRQHNLYRFDR